jgi:hypothetical protein
VASCRSCVNRRFGWTYRLHLHGRKIRERRTTVSRWLQTVWTDVSEERIASIFRVEQFCSHCSRWFLASGFFYPEDRGDTFLLEVGSHKIYIAPQSQKMTFFIVTAVKTSNLTF